jgi:PadR family transcriptional regulator PadR
VAESEDRDLYSGLIRLHVLHHASQEPIFGLGMLEELGRHGYRISPGTLYPILHGLEKGALAVVSNLIQCAATSWRAFPVEEIPM